MALEKSEKHFFFINQATKIPSVTINSSENIFSYILTIQHPVLMHADSTCLIYYIEYLLWKIPCIHVTKTGLTRLYFYHSSWFKSIKGVRVNITWQKKKKKMLLSKWATVSSTAEVRAPERARTGVLAANPVQFDSRLPVTSAASLRHS